jgi:nitronate monooxygenase
VSRIPPAWLETIALPVIAAPMFLVSTVDLLATCVQNGVIAAMPAGNARTPELFAGWVEDLVARLAATQTPHAPWAINLVVHRTNKRLAADLATCVRFKAPLVITALGGPQAVVDDIHAYGGLVFADVNDIAFARKAAAAGVDGLVLVCSGAGGHTGSIAMPAFLAAVRTFFDGIVVVAGGMSTGAHILAAQAMGADFCYMGTRFIATHESSAFPAYKQMIVDSTYADIICTAAITGALANKLRPSLIAAGLDPDNLVKREKFDLSDRENDVKAWKDLWSAGHGVGVVDAIEPAAAIIARLKAEYAAAVERDAADPFVARYASAATR